MNTSFGPQKKLPTSLESALQELHANLHLMAEFCLDSAQQEAERIDFLHTFAGQKSVHLSVKLIILDTIRDRSEGLVSEHAGELGDRLTSAEIPHVRTPHISNSDLNDLTFNLLR